MILPTTITVAANGAVTVDSGAQTVAMSPFSERAKQLAAAFGPGTVVLREQADVDVIRWTTLDVIAEVLA